MNEQVLHLNTLRKQVRKYPKDQTAYDAFFVTACEFLKENSICMWCRFPEVCGELMRLFSSSQAKSPFSLWFCEQTAACLNGCSNCIHCYYEIRPKQMSYFSQSFSDSELLAIKKGIHEYDKERLISTFNRYINASIEERKAIIIKYRICEVLLYPGWFCESSMEFAFERTMEIILETGKMAKITLLMPGLAFCLLHRYDKIREWALENLVSATEEVESHFVNYSWKTVFALLCNLSAEKRTIALKHFRAHMRILKLKLETEDYSYFAESIMAELELPCPTVRFEQFLASTVELLHLMNSQGFDWHKVPEVTLLLSLEGRLNSSLQQSTSLSGILYIMICNRFEGVKLERLCSFLKEAPQSFTEECASWLCNVTLPYFTHTKDFSPETLGGLSGPIAQVSFVTLQNNFDDIYVFLFANPVYDSELYTSGLVGLLEAIMKRRGGSELVNLASLMIPLAAHLKIDFAVNKIGQVLRVVCTSAAILPERIKVISDAVKRYRSTSGGNANFKLESTPPSTSISVQPTKKLDSSVDKIISRYEQRDAEFLNNFLSKSINTASAPATTQKPASKLHQLRQEMTQSSIPMQSAQRKRPPTATVTPVPPVKTPKTAEASSDEEPSISFTSDLFKSSSNSSLPMSKISTSTPAPSMVSRSVKMIDTDEGGLKLSGQRITTKAQQMIAVQKLNREWQSSHKLHQFILSIDFSALSEANIKTLVKLENSSKTIPERFASHQAYFKVFEPLLRMECLAQLLQSKEEIEGTAVYNTAIVKYVSNVDSFVEILFLFEGRSIDRLFSEQDLIVGHPRQLANPNTAEILGLVTKSQCFAEGLEVTVRFYLQKLTNGELTAQLTRLNTHWRFTRLTNLVTVSREYLALENLARFQCADHILNPRFILPGPEISTKIESFAAYCQRNFVLNAPQARAVAYSLLNSNFFSLIQGPPGTGKTSTIEGLLAACFVPPRPGCPVNVKKSRVLICAPSNTAIDEIVRRIKGGVRDAEGRLSKLSVVRVGAIDSVHEDVKDVTMDILADELFTKRFGEKLNQLEAQKQTAAELKDKLYGSDKNDDSDAGLRKRLHFLKLEIKTTSGLVEKSRQTVRKQVLNEAQVVCCTLSAAGMEVFGLVDDHFDTVIIDEACQAVELSALIPLQYGCKRAILVGDPNQLPPTVISQEAAQFCYDQSLFQRLETINSKAVQLLSVQYRMHPEISSFPSRFFYKGRLLDGPGMDELRTRPWHSCSSFKLGPYQIFDIIGRESSNNRSNSLFNNAEAETAVAIVRQLTASYPDYNFTDNIGIITPYKDQRSRIKKLLVQEFGYSILKFIEVSTIDGYQGQEKEIIIFSCVRSERMGFLNDFRRLNVAVTRAKSSLFVIGNVKLLERSKGFWTELISNAESRNVLVPFNQDYWRRTKTLPINNLNIIKE